MFCACGMVMGLLQQHNRTLMGAAQWLCSPCVQIHPLPTAESMVIGTMPAHGGPQCILFSRQEHGHISNK